MGEKCTLNDHLLWWINPRHHISTNGPNCCISVLTHPQAQISGPVSRGCIDFFFRPAQTLYMELPLVIQGLSQSSVLPLGVRYLLSACTVVAMIELGVYGTSHVEPWCLCVPPRGCVHTFILGIQACASVLSMCTLSVRASACGHCLAVSWLPHVGCAGRSVCSHRYTCACTLSPSMALHCADITQPFQQHHLGLNCSSECQH